MYRIIILSPIVLAGMDHSLFAAENRITGFSSGDTLTIQSAVARMDELPDIVHFDGGFELRANDWSLSSDQATLYGKLDDPETVILSGAPASILVQTISNGELSTISGEASAEDVADRPHVTVLAGRRSNPARGERIRRRHDLQPQLPAIHR